MNASKIKTILHPVRMKIIQALINGKEMTAQELAQWAEDVPQATLYRHINKLLDADFIEIVQENPVRGTVEKVYALKEPDVQSQEDYLKLSKEEHLELFLTFTTQLLSLYESYLAQDDVDIVKDGVSYTMANLYLSDQEFMELMQGIGSLIGSAIKNEPTPERRARNIATVIIPEPRKK
ncbi:helix-turn-helix domain-containing protein [Niallia sp. Krafla_26]|uniref:helix-turn-helix domain-containing protein n=1 Tax=Niallia sp. Krafla_26 TaxID=3064703 RepID=UPI003D1832C1